MIHRFRKVNSNTVRVCIQREKKNINISAEEYVAKHYFHQTESTLCYDEYGVLVTKTIKGFWFDIITQLTEERFKSQRDFCACLTEIVHRNCDRIRMMEQSELHSELKQEIRAASKQVTDIKHKELVEAVELTFTEYDTMKKKLDSNKGLSKEESAAFKKFKVKKTYNLDEPLDEPFIVQFADDRAVAKYRQLSDNFKRPIEQMINTGRLDVYKRQAVLQQVR